MNRDIFLVGNWKMYITSQKEAESLAAGVVRGVEAVKPSKNIHTVLCPPHPHLKPVQKELKRDIVLGAQNVWHEDRGAFTGEVSAKMLKDVLCEYVIVGHSERRKYFGEDEELVNKKVKAVLQHNMRPIIAIGEKERDGRVRDVITRQLNGALDGVSAKEVKKVLIAYEPVWAIGTGQAAQPDDVMSVRILIRKLLGKLYSEKTAQSVPVLYGGSTDSKNINNFVFGAEMDGALVGGASAKADEFVKMVENISNKQVNK